MRRLVQLVLVATLIAGASTSPAHAQGQGPCSGWFSNVRPDMNHNGVIDANDRARVHHKVEHLIACAVRIWPVAGGVYYAQAIAERESSMWPWAQNVSSLCSGVYQDVLSLWSGRVQRYWDPDWFWRTPSVFNARANVIVNIRLAHDAGWGPWGG